ncbi:NUDIX hydrolase [Butyrivibrio sp. MC2013]|uniref:NUDIX hydrolase n=1 Tax=Butyrivibrio sp. MC2013 TaxID=1280686 RepID=UPI000428D05E|nr:NUDIX hydrolase [Butyrivibrio sp. MC2013]
MEGERKLRLTGRRLVYEGGILDLYKDSIICPDGSHQEWDFVKHKIGYGAGVLPVLGDGNIMLIRQFRPEFGQELWEIPAGCAEKDDADTSVSALRELKEETGLISSDIRFLCRNASIPAFCNEWADIYVAYDCEPSPEGQCLDGGEDITTAVFSLDELKKMIRDKEIIDSKAVAAICAYGFLCV